MKVKQSFRGLWGKNTRRRKKGRKTPGEKATKRKNGEHKIGERTNQATPVFATALREQRGTAQKA